MKRTGSVIDVGPHNIDLGPRNVYSHNVGTISVPSFLRANLKTATAMSAPGPRPANKTVPIVKK